MPRWTLEARKKQRALINQVKPWLKSTGARTSKGKARSAMNARKHGFYSVECQKEMREIKELLKRFSEKVR